MSPPPAASTPWPPGRRGVLVAGLLAVVLMGGGMFTMGMPGYALFVAGDWPVGHRLRPLHGDQLLTLAFLMNLAWPPVLPLAQWLAGRWLRRPGPTPSGSRRAAAWALLALLLAGWAVLLATGLHALVARPDALPA